MGSAGSGWNSSGKAKEMQSIGWRCCGSTAARFPCGRAASEAVCHQKPWSPSSSSS
jgi:hypothetical protein